MNITTNLINKWNDGCRESPKIRAAQSLLLTVVLSALTVAVVATVGAASHLSGSDLRDFICQQMTSSEVMGSLGGGLGLFVVGRQLYIGWKVDKEAKLDKLNYQSANEFYTELEHKRLRQGESGRADSTDSESESINRFRARSYSTSSEDSN